MNQISRISPISDEEAARAVSREAFEDLADRIMATPVGSVRPVNRRRRRWIAASTVAAALAGALLLVSSVGGELGPGSAAALSVTRHGGYIDVIVRDPLADPKRYQEELAAHNIDIKLSLVPASPSVVGTVVFIGQAGGQIQPITAVGKCTTGGGGPVCPVGVRIPLGFHGSGHVAFGRAPRPGEQYESSGSADAPGEALHGIRYRGRTVAAVLAMLRARHVTVPQYRHETANYGYSLTPDRVPGIWHVYDAVPWAPGQVLLFVGPARH